MGERPGRRGKGEGGRAKGEGRRAEGRGGKGQRVAVAGLLGRRRPRPPRRLESRPCRKTPRGRSGSWYTTSSICSKARSSKTATEKGHPHARLWKPGRHGQHG